ncbi:hypothetical protein BGZ54_000514 [Gamsiella multidivaricata]|nr:hypothetical protein BGZ54_000514 [Gamsiella multidivaricata]
MQQEEPQQQQQQQVHLAGHGHAPASAPVLTPERVQEQYGPIPTGAPMGGPLEQEFGFNNIHRPHSPFPPPPFLHPNMMHLMQQQHLFHQHQQQQQQHPHGHVFHQVHEFGVSDTVLKQHSSGQGDPSSTKQEKSASVADESSEEHGDRTGERHSAEESQRSLADRHSMDSPQLRQVGLHTMAQHPMSVINVPGSPGPPRLDNEFGGPSMVPMHPHFMAMNRMTPPPGFGHFPMHTMQGAPFQTPFQQQQQFHHHQQMFMHQQMLRQQQQQMHQFQASPQHPLQHDPSHQALELPHLGDNRGQSAGVVGRESLTVGTQQDQIKNIESQINQLLFKGDSAEGVAQGPGASDHSGTSSRPLSGQCLTVQEIEEAQVKDLQNQMRRVSLTDPVSPPRSRSIPSVPEHVNGAEANLNAKTPADHQLASSSHHLSNILDSRFQNPSPIEGSTPRYEQTAEKAPFSVKDIDFYSDRRYDPYRPSSHVLDLITRDAKVLCHDLMPKPEEETRKLALLRRLSDIANEVFGQAEVLPFGSSGNGLALANADMDVCVFLTPREGSEEVSPVEFVERIGDRLEKDSEFENILQLKRARVPIVKLNHINGIACDIGYQNDLAIWNTRLLRAYCRIDGRVRDVVVVIKTWAKRRKINNPYTGSLSSYAYVLLVIHVLQRRGVLPNLQSIVAGNGKVPYWDCQGFNRYFFEDIANLSRYWQPTPEAMKQSVGELLYEFFRYFASEFRYASQVVSIRSGGLLTKEIKEWTKDHTQPQQQQQQQQPRPQTPTESTAQIEGQALLDTKPIVKNRYLFCIEDPFELDHNVGRPVDRYSLFTIRGEFMRAAKILSKNGDGAITRLCYEREVPSHQERNRNSSIDHGDDQARDRSQQKERPSSRGSNADGTALDNSSRGGGKRGSSGRVGTFPAGEDKLQDRDSPAHPRVKVQGTHEGGTGSLSGTGPHEQGQRPRSGRRSFYKRATIGSEPRNFTKV